MYKGQYVPPIVVVDSVIFQLVNDELAVLLIERSQEPFQGKRALPGGYDAAGETTHDAMQRILKLKAGLDVKDLGLVEQLYTFDTVARDPRGHAISITYMGLGKDLSPSESSTTQKPAFMPVGNLPKLAYDHTDIITYAVERLRAKISYTNAIFALLPKLFTLSQLQTAYEAVLGHELDKRNFRKKFLALNLIEDSKEIHKEGAHRPARLYRFRQPGLQTLTRNFD